MSSLASRIGRAVSAVLAALSDSADRPRGGAVVVIAPPGEGPRPVDAAAPTDPKAAIYATAEAAYEDLHRAARPSHMLGCDGFEACVEAMRSSVLSNADLLGFYSG
ncbi:MAG: hypothetical protein ACKOTB_00325, partial [Planctomycetia bacterium]